jgi:hypothetical protein
LEAVAGDLEPDFIFLRKSWCNPNTTDASLSILNYKLETELTWIEMTQEMECDKNGLFIPKMSYRLLLLTHFNNFNQHCRFNKETKLDPINVVLVYRLPWFREGK